MMLRRWTTYLGLATLLLTRFEAVGEMFAQAPNEPLAQPEEYAPGVPRVYLTAAHAKLCKARVGDPFPVQSLSNLNGGDATTIQQLAGAKATVVLFWSNEGWMSRAALRDVSRAVAEQFDPKEVTVVGIAVLTSREDATTAMRNAGAQFPQLLDADGRALAKIGSGLPPRILVLDERSEQEHARIAWFDIEYSEATRREMRQTLSALVNSAGEARAD